MIKVSAGKKDVGWNFAGTFFSMTSGFLLLPFVLGQLTSDEIGMWYVYVAIGNLTLLFEFGFNPTFARNIIYCLSGTRRLSKTGGMYPSEKHREGEIDYHLLKCILKTSRVVYGVIAAIAAVVVLTAGSWYIWYIGGAVEPRQLWVSWLIICVAMVLNLYYYYAITFLRGFGDVAGENRAKTYAKVLQLFFSASLLLAGCGLVGTAMGYLIGGVGLRGFALALLKRHHEVWSGLDNDTAPVTKDELREVFASISFIAWRDGIVQLSLYLSTQAASILCSLFLTLSETGTISITMQLGTAVYQLSGAYARSFYPEFQSGFARGDRVRLRELVSRAVTAYYMLYLISVLGLLFVVLPILRWTFPDKSVSPWSFICFALYFFFWYQHNIFCNYIVSMNEIPYVLGYVICGMLGVFLGGLGLVAGWGPFGLVAGLFVGQVVYNNWKWPMFLLRSLDVTYMDMVRSGMGYWKGIGRKIVYG